MLKHEKKAFWKFFITYFGSVALLILASGFFYFQEQKKTLIEKEHFSMIEFIRQVKMKQNPKNNQDIKYEMADIEAGSFNMNNFDIQDTHFAKYMPYNWEGKFILVKKDKTHYHEVLFSLKIYIIIIQILLLVIFATLSYILSIRALKPMREAIVKLDNFSKDLIHDLNTPVTSILLNIKLLEKQTGFESNKPLMRIKHNVEDISALHNNLSFLLEEKNISREKENIYDIVQDVIQTYERIYPTIDFECKDFELYVNVNHKAFKQVLINLLSNACKYNRKNGFVKVYVQDKKLFIEDNGIGIKSPDAIFQRSYKEHIHGTGIGLDIVKRLCDAMNIEIEVVSKLNRGSKFILKFE